MKLSRETLLGDATDGGGKLLAGVHENHCQLFPLQGLPFFPKTIFP